MADYINRLNRSSVKHMVLKDDIKRFFVYWQLMKVSLECLRTSDTLKEWATIAKANKDKSFVDYRVLASDQQRSLDAMILKMKTTMDTDTWNVVMNHLTSEQMQEMNLLLNELTELNEHAIEAITTNVKQAKVNAQIPLNDPTEDTTDMVEMDRAILSCIYPAENGDMYDRGEVYAALKILYKKMKAEL